MVKRRNDKTGQYTQVAFYRDATLIARSRGICVSE
jgi:hypothetical protein